MRSVLIFTLLILNLCLMGSNPKPFVVPELREWSGGEGYFSLNPQSTRICIADDDLEIVAKNFAAHLKAISGMDLPVVREKGKKGDLILCYGKDRKLDPEGYKIKIGDKVELSSPSAEGARWGTMTLLQMFDQDAHLPKGEIADYPQYEFRGFLIDAGRKYIPLDYLYTLVDVLAYRKMNVLHIHLNDNGFKEFFNSDWDKTQAAFRLECTTFPGLTARDGSYSKDEFRALQKYASERGVEIIPEIDFPAHSLAFTRYRPDIAASGKSVDKDHLDLDAPATYEFLDSLLKEYLEGPDPVFSGRRFHIGTDEYQGDSITMEKFRAFTDRYIRYTEKFGKSPFVWGSLTHAKGVTPVKSEGVGMYLWYNGYADPQTMIKDGYDVVSIPDGYVYIVPGAGYYYDYLDTAMLYNEWTPANIGAVTVDEEHPQLLGGMFAVWNDHPNNGITVKDIHHRVMHALPTLATKTWDGSHVSLPHEDFSRMASTMREAPGVNYLGRHGNGREIILEIEELTPSAELPIKEIGYDYTVEFCIECSEEEKGTALFANDDATLWLSDPISGTMGYSREGKLMHFRHALRDKDKIHVKITGDNKGVKLYIDGKLIDDMNISWATYGVKEKGRQRHMADVKTLVFPLGRAGKFRSKVTNIIVKNYIDGE